MKCTLMSQCLKNSKNVSFEWFVYQVKNLRRDAAGALEFDCPKLWNETFLRYFQTLWILLTVMNLQSKYRLQKNVGLQTAFCYRFLLDNLTICNVASSFKFLELLRTWKECLREFWPDGHIIRGRTVITYNAAYDTFSSRLLGLHISRYLRHL